MAHSRRKFFFAEKEEKKASKGKKAKASVIMQYIGKLYAIEKEIKELSLEEKLNQRTLKSIPILEAIEKWLFQEKDKVLPKSLLGKAISYALNQWDKLIEFTKNPLVPIDNNYLEAQIKNFAVGRKNWLFSSSENGAHASATLYSLIASAKVNGLDPYKYLHLIFKELPKCDTLEDYEKLLPYDIKNNFSI